MLSICLIAGAEPERVVALQRGLKSHGVQVHAVPDARSLLPTLGQWRFDAIVCHAAAHADADLEAVRWLRHEQRAPVVVLADAGSEERLVGLLEAGATELVAATVSPRLLALKLRRLAELAADGPDDTPRAVSLGALRLDPRRAEAVYADRALPLTGSEFDLLLLLAAQSDGFVHRDAIARTLGRAAARDGESRRSADMHVCRIRRKLRDAGASSLEVETIYGRGYALRLRERAEHAASQAAPPLTPPARSLR